MSFLSLPRELRNEVYAYATDLRTHSSADYSGFYMSCRQIKEELDIEGARCLKAYLTKFKPSSAAHEGFLFDVPDTLKDMRNLRISLGTWTYTKFWGNAPSVDDLAWGDLFRLHLDSLTITYHDNKPVEKIMHCKTVSFMGLLWLEDNILEKARIARVSPYVGRLVIDLQTNSFDYWGVVTHSRYPLWTLQSCVTQSLSHELETMGRDIVELLIIEKRDEAKQWVCILCMALVLMLAFAPGLSKVG
ncbi:hypothetical protein CC86DRAFT_406064 [Ophiobolus disseminans]|uniref:Uncharacterized protein n=1 Tax=Ophiobolus disseminans TaxID=1469910 RepID=A0A6A7A2N4_9PLEO|nr:hypothetical protein CC86DRAFT_406064 [Ophiobolus disseminans]